MDFTAKQGQLRGTRGGLLLPHRLPSTPLTNAHHHDFIIITIIIIIIIMVIVIIIIITRPWPAFGRQGLVGSSGGYTYHGYTSHASPRACGAQLG